MFGVKPENAITVGDFIFDLIAGKEAGTKTALILNDKNRGMLESFKSYADYIFDSLKELAEFLGVAEKSADKPDAG
jgi:phosphoglycolate phosphatase-like HAD superfamily hydrolase